MNTEQWQPWTCVRFWSNAIKLAWYMGMGMLWYAGCHSTGYAAMQTQNGTKACSLQPGWQAVDWLPQFLLKTGNSACLSASLTTANVSDMLLEADKLHRATWNPPLAIKDHDSVLSG